MWACARPLSLLSSPHRNSSEAGTREDGGSQGKAAHVRSAPSYSTPPHCPFAEYLFPHRSSRELACLNSLGAHSRDLPGPDFCFKASLKQPLYLVFSLQEKSLSVQRNDTYFISSTPTPRLWEEVIIFRLVYAVNLVF